MLIDGATPDPEEMLDEQPTQEAGQADQVDPWAAAFASLEEPPAAPDADAEAGGGEPGDGAPAEDAGGAAGVAADDAAVGADAAGGPAPAATGAGAGIDLGEIEATVARYTASIEEKAIDETARLFLDRADDKGNKLIRQKDGKLGATLSDPDIYRVDPQTGAASFYNPDTGKPFTGDNPRAQAKQWVEAYNESLRDAFNELAGKRQAELEKESAPVIQLLKFMPKYEKLDPVRRQMLDALLDGDEILDEKGKCIGYNTDLDRALDRVNRQVAAIKASQPKPEPKPPTSPALDLPSVGGGSRDTGRFKTLAEALEAQQDAQLSKLKK